MSKSTTIRIAERPHVDQTVEELTALFVTAASEGNRPLMDSIGLELNVRSAQKKRAALLAVDWDVLNKGGNILPNGGRMGPKTDIALVIALVTNASFLKRKLDTGKAAFEDADVEAIKATLDSNVLTGRGSECHIKSTDVTVLDNGHLRVICTPSQATQDDVDGMNVFAVTTTDDGPVKVERWKATHQVPIQGSAA
tara:strand:- start:2548 stop:3135 length:588 start_codon:yes stop_codon:yes gene_type:complete